MANFDPISRAERLHAQADYLSALEPQHRGTTGGKFLLDRIKALRERAYALEELG